MDVYLPNACKYILGGELSSYANTKTHRLRKINFSQVSWVRFLMCFVVDWFTSRSKYSMYVQDEDRFNTKWVGDCIDIGREGIIGKHTFNNHNKKNEELDTY